MACSVKWSGPVCLVLRSACWRVLSADRNCSPLRAEPCVIISPVRRGQEVFAKRQKLGEDVIGYAYTIKMRALARLGELLKQLPKATGTRSTGRPRLGGSKREPPISDAPTLAELGVTKKVSSVAQQLATMPVLMSRT